MKYLMLVIMLMLSAEYAFADGQKCTRDGNKTTCVTEKDTDQDVNTPVPDDLKDATIIIVTKDGKKHSMSANQFKVVKRQQQFKVKEVDTTYEPVVVNLTPVYVTKVLPEPHKNLLILDGHVGYTDVGVSQDGNTVSVNDKQQMIYDFSYFRRALFDSRFGIGAGIDTDKRIHGMIGYEF